MPSSLFYDKFQKEKPKGRKKDVERGRNFLRRMGESGSEIRRSRQKRKARSAGLILAENDTEPGAVDDDAKERIKRRKKQLEEAAG